MGASPVAGAGTPLPHSPSHQVPMLSFRLLSLLESVAYRPGKPAFMPSPSVDMRRAPDSVSVDSGPSFASLNGKRSRNLPSASENVCLRLSTLDRMPSLKVSKSRAPDSKRSRPESHSVACAQASRIQSPIRK